MVFASFFRAMFHKALLEAVSIIKSLFVNVKSLAGDLCKCFIRHFIGVLVPVIAVAAAATDLSKTTSPTWFIVCRDYVWVSRRLLRFSLGKATAVIAAPGAMGVAVAAPLVVVLADLSKATAVIATPWSFVPAIADTN